VEAFTHRTDGGPAIFTDWKETVYVDLAPPNSAPSSFSSTSYQQWTLDVTSVDGLANSVHTFIDLPSGLTNAQILAQINSSNQATQEDTNLWQSSYSNLNSGNHVLTVVSYKPDGNYNIQRFTENQYSYLGVTNGNGAGLGDLNADGTINSTDISQFATIVQSNNTQFNPAADINGDGNVDLADTFLLGPILSAHNVSSATWNTYNAFIFGTYVTTGTYNVVGTNVIYQDTAGTTNVTASSTLNATYVRGTALTIAAGGLAQIQSNSTFGNGTSKVSSLTLAGSTGAWTGQLDLENNSIVVESTAANRAAELTQLTNMVAEGYDGGKWNGDGITSSTAEADTTYLHAVGIILNDNGYGSPIYPSFDGQTADDNAILIAYTYYGDANLDGRVDGSDYSLVDNGFHNHLTGWHNGDFNYDGVVDGSDYTLIDNSYNMQGSPGAYPGNQIALATEQIAPTNAAAVPEPASLSILMIGGLLLGRRRKTSAQKSQDSRAVPGTNISYGARESDCGVPQPRQKHFSAGPF
jgi:hypothetical protein